MSEPCPPYTAEQLLSDAVTKKDLASFLQNSAAEKFLAARKLLGNLKNVCKVHTKEQFIEHYNTMFQRKAFKNTKYEEPVKQASVQRPSSSASTKENNYSINSATTVNKTRKTGTDANANEINGGYLVLQKINNYELRDGEMYRKTVLEKGNGHDFPMVGDVVVCHYVSKLQDGTIFDSRLRKTKKGKKCHPFKFKIGENKVIRAWEEAVLDMSIGEKAELLINPDWGYGKKGAFEGKVPPDAVLVCELELSGIDR
ncbi:peptidyl-prolyl cis-trans isomerase FKBP3 [Lingula anatina]|uniref:peptidylprolyl isomerase n=1 Tax=Lingula anatina TaxID=7574 RepID=A0A1S3H139_LINAN|nr:peptidyl-prolyl cis-trans isomerase FKBP3 [Lingula anatina]|eukprot:XP_013379723.1 peptidyl-prolyl cis-trans isomerase FKBP3 [Lingula anatina]